MERIYIFAEIMEFFDKIIMDTESAKETALFKVMQKIVFSDEIKIAVPRYVLFDNTDYIDIMDNSYAKHRPFYDVNMDCFLYKGINNFCYGIQEILKKINDEYPNDMNVFNNYNRVHLALKIINDSIALDELCNAINMVCKV